MDFKRAYIPLALTVLLLFGCGRQQPDPTTVPPIQSLEPGSSAAPVAPSSTAPDPRADMADKLRAGIARNRDTIGWLTIPGTTVDAAVLQAEDNAYYLRLNEDRRYEVFGCYFMDYEAKTGGRNELSRNNIIYGHSDLRDNKEGPKFSQLFRYLDSEFLQAHPYIYYATTRKPWSGRFSRCFLPMLTSTISSPTLGYPLCRGD